MAEEMIFTINLKEAKEMPRARRAPKAIKIVREFLAHHMKGDVKLGKYLNEEIWARGAKKPPRRVSIRAVKEGDVITAELVGANVEKEAVDEKHGKKEHKNERAHEDSHEHVHEHDEKKHGKE